MTRYRAPQPATCPLCSKETVDKAPHWIAGKCRQCYNKHQWKRVPSEKRRELVIKKIAWNKSEHGRALTRVASRERYKADPERFRKQLGESYSRHRQKRIQEVIEYIKRNPEKRRKWQANWNAKPGVREAQNAYQRRWIKAHPEVNRSSVRRRRARELGVYTEHVDYKAIWDASNKMCGICKKRVALKDRTFDHIIPIARGGPHVATNIQIAHHSCNSRRGAGRIPAQMRLVA